MTAVLNWSHPQLRVIIRENKRFPCHEIVFPNEEVHWVLRDKLCLILFSPLSPVHLWTGRVPWRDRKGLQTVGVVSKPEWQPYWIIPAVLLQPERPRPSGPHESFKRKLQQNGVERCGVAAGRYTAGCCYHCRGCLLLLRATSERLWKIGRLNNITTADSLSTASSETKPIWS